ncbi:MAG: glycosyltransferase family 4 protein [Kiritimatiellae bacterium]|nr:glycosyltransferase family 4 protein [Kiritimatiellia bacterium]MDD5521365.1 glycosyltransferase family 4 protein [Kiritimatiellia bacterium]
MTVQSHHIAFVCPRFAEGSTIGGAETLLKNLAIRTAAAGRKVTFLTTCARNHFTWENELPAGSKAFQGMEVHFFPVDTDRNISRFLNVQELISRRCRISHDDELAWFKNNVNSTALCKHLVENGTTYDRIVMGPYLFGLIYFASLIHPEKTLLVPCLHDEAFAYLESFGQMFNKVHGFMFNSEPERDLANRLYGVNQAISSVVGMGLDDFASDPQAFAISHHITSPYLIYSGRREPMKGTPLLLDYFRTFKSRTKQDIKLVLTGAGQIDILPEITDSVLDTGFLDEHDKHNAMAGAVAFCHPSVNESFGIVVLESWLARTPSLVHEKSAVLKYQCQKSNGGMWFKTYPEFEEELLLLINKPEIRNTMGETGRKYVLSQYSWNTIVPKLLEALDR